ncbi:hypothetical protein CKO18_10750 [Rhodoferax fermentans]|uniref:Uncharacterized protein n=2 Tax=Rhodoferax fermentans TaxID=28066 RepID=A0A1T1AUH7_RHOFE|nr:hypothetical protein [Rhodoferax fermentans]OOV07717.1 hypothetical protein RF819_14185 [Rhodoferax fermentans]
MSAPASNHAPLCVGTLLFLAGELYAVPCKLSELDQGRIRWAIASLLKAAYAGGFTQGDILATLLARKDTSNRVIDLATQAFQAADRSLK